MKKSIKAENTLEHEFISVILQDTRIDGSREPTTIFAVEIHRGAQINMGFSRVNEKANIAKKFSSPSEDVIILSNEGAQNMNCYMFSENIMPVAEAVFQKARVPGCDAGAAGTIQAISPPESPLKMTVPQAVEAYEQKRQTYHEEILLADQKMQEYIAQLEQRVRVLEAPESLRSSGLMTVSSVGTITK
ncbi:hypothetical protein H0H92_002291 [Tricholoma furcatifolium]|nr:hypothetical protein H0H92_002291 [Tricholoma furcatifolium]